VLQDQTAMHYYIDEIVEILVLITHAYRLLSVLYHWLPILYNLLHVSTKVFMNFLLYIQFLNISIIKTN